MTEQSGRKRHPFWKNLQKLTASPYLNILVGIIMLVSGVSEVWKDFEKDFVTTSLGSHHGILAFGFLHVLRYLPEVFDGMDHIYSFVERE